MKKSCKNCGFALIVSLAIMSLILLFTLAALQMSRIAIKHSETEIHRKKAKQNAELGLHLAISQLQKYAGSDKRVTARANVSNYLGARTENESILGIWNSSKFDPTQTKQSQDRNWPVWMISQDDGFTISTSIDNERKEILFDNTEDQRSIPAYRIPLTDSSGQTDGYYSWAIDDEGMKASLKNISSDSNFEYPLNSIQSLSISSEPIYSDLLKRNLSTRQQSNLKKLLSYDQIPIALEFQNRDTDNFGSFYNRDYTAENFFLLTDVKNGGLKHDLSLAFAMSDNSFNSTPEFSGDYQNLGENFISGFVFQNATPDGTIKGPTWQLLRAHAKLGESISSKQPLINAQSYKPTPATIETVQDFDQGRHGLASQWQYMQLTNQGRPEIDSVIQVRASGTPTATIRPTAPAIHPIILNYQNVVSMRAAPLAAGDPAPTDASFNRKLEIILDFNITIWNPYNVPMRVPAMIFEVVDIAMELDYDVQNVYISDRYGYTDEPLEASKLGLQTRGYINNPLTRIFPLVPGPGSQQSPILLYDPPGGLILAPGETRVLSLSGTNPVIYQSGNLLDAGLNISAGIYSDLPLRDPRYWDNSSAYVRSNKVRDKVYMIYLNNTSQIRARLRANNAISRIRAYLAPAGIGAKVNTISNYHDLRKGLENHIIQSFMGEFKVGEGTQYEGEYTSFLSTADLDYALGGFKQPIGMMEMYFKTTQHAIQPIRTSQHNHRSFMSDMSTQYDMDYFNLNAPYDYGITSLTDWTNDIIQVDASNRSYWGDYTDATGQTNVSFYEVPTKPLVSMIELRHANLMLPNHHNNYNLGFSEAHPFIPRNATFNKLTINKAGGWGGVDGVVKLRDYYTYDMPYLMNEALLDKYYFSGITKIDTNDSSEMNTSLKDAFNDYSSGDISKVLNTHMRPISGKFGPKGFTNDQFINGAEPTDNAYRKLAATSWIQNGLNVNSTSPRAWSAFIKNSLTKNYQYYDSSYNNDSTTGWIVSRFSIPNAGIGNFWSGTRTISDEEIYDDHGTPDTSDDTGLAVEIVKQIKKRGPFLNLSDFVNRRLIDGELGERSALAQAIEDSGINKDATTYKDVATTDYPSAVPYKENGVGSSGDAFPGYIRSDDILSPIFPALSARSDTFTIRSSGESVDKYSGKTQAKVVIEAIVQRMPDPVEAKKTEDMTSLEYFDVSSSSFGRKFQVIFYRIIQL